MLILAVEKVNLGIRVFFCSCFRNMKELWIEVFDLVFFFFKARIFKNFVDVGKNYCY